ncbi:adenylate/guanylate cyclase domain-containing protein [Nocardioides sp.]|uniref:adenylate/guanylate cyclase domain-containing protein n=1 Tax=Nocardioides sp. TaxID=35761 RepID=UPI0031FE7CF3
MTTWALVAVSVLAALELAALIVVHARWRRARRRARRYERELDRLLDQQLERGREKRWTPGRIPTTREAVRAVWETAALVREKGVGGALQHSIDDLAGWAQVERPDLDRLAAGDGSVAILFSDIEGSTALNDELGDKQWVRILGRHDAVVRRCVEAHDGHVIKTQGDGFMVAFGPAQDAVTCAVDIQRALAPTRQRRAGPQIRVRIGIHRGRAVRRDGDLFGRNVAYAARVASLAGGGEILVSEAVVVAMADAFENGDSPFDEGRDVELKGLAGPHRVHAVAWSEELPVVLEGEPVTDP